MSKSFSRISVNAIANGVLSVPPDAASEHPEERGNPGHPEEQAFLLRFGIDFAGRSPSLYYYDLSRPEKGRLKPVGFLQTIKLPKSIPSQTAG